MSPEQMEVIIDQLYRRQIETIQGGDKPCEHYTLRLARLPCPHPVCGTDQPVLYTQRRCEGFPGWYGADKPINATYETERWRRDKLVFVGGEVVWAWRPA